MIKKQERRIGAPLFERTCRTVRLTSVGDVRGTLTFGTMGPQGWVINDIVDRFRTRHPAVQFVHRGSVCLEDYGELTFVAPHQSLDPPSMEEMFQSFRTPSGRLITRGRVVTNWDDQLKAVSAGIAEAARFYPWPNLAYVPVRDARPVDGSSPGALPPPTP